MISGLDEGALSDGLAPPMRLHLGFRSSDVDEIREVASAAQHPLTFDRCSAGGAFRFHLHHHPLTRMALTHARLVHEGRIRVEAPPIGSHYHLQIPLRNGSRVRHGSHCVETVPGRRALLLSPHRGTRFDCRGGFEEVTLEIDRRALGEAWMRLTGEPTARVPALPCALRLDLEPGASVLRLVRRMLGVLARPASEPASAVVLPEMEESILLRLLELSARPESAPHRTPAFPPQGASLAREAERWIERHADRPCTIAAVAEAHGVSIRTLQRAFERHRGTTPRALLRKVRLERARWRLGCGERDASVSRIAHESGLAHFGRFSAAYRARYGEPPSATLRRARRRSGVGGRGVAYRLVSSVRPVSMGVCSRVDGRCGLCAGGVPDV